MLYLKAFPNEIYGGKKYPSGIYKNPDSLSVLLG